MAVNLKAELEASRSLVELLELADRTRQLYQSARIPLPDALRRLLGSGVGGDELAAVIPQPSLPPSPPEADADWSWIPLTDGAPTSLIKAILRGQNEGMRSKDLYERIRSFGARSSLGSVSNAAVKLQEQGVLERSDDGSWKLLKSEAAGIIHEGHLWGPKNTFRPQELAAHRRGAILYVLRINPGGLQLAQITDQLRRMDWIRAPINKDLVKGDMDWLLGERKVRRITNSRKWVLALEG
jgi:hypothetical protein